MCIDKGSDILHACLSCVERAARPEYQVSETNIIIMGTNFRYCGACSHYLPINNYQHTRPNGSCFRHAKGEHIVNIVRPTVSHFFGYIHIQPARWQLLSKNALMFPKVDAWPDHPRETFLCRIHRLQQETEQRRQPRNSSSSSKTSSSSSSSSSNNLEVTGGGRHLLAA